MQGETAATDWPGLTLTSKAKQRVHTCIHDVSSSTGLGPSRPERGKTVPRLSEGSAALSGPTGLHWLLPDSPTACLPRLKVSSFLHYPNYIKAFLQMEHLFRLKLFSPTLGKGKKETRPCKVSEPHHLPEKSGLST